MRTEKAKETQWQQAHPKAGASYHPRKLYRGLKFELRTGPGQKYLHPERRRSSNVINETVQEEI